MIPPWIYVCRLWSLTATTVPVTVGGALAACDGHFSWTVMALCLVSGWLLQIATNLLNSYGDFISGVDNAEAVLTTPQLFTGELKPRPVFRAGVAALVLGAATGAAVCALTDWRLLFFAAAGVSGAGFYTTGFAYKYAGGALPIVALLAGTVMTLAAYFAQTGTVTWGILIVSLPITCQVGAILHGNDLRDVMTDRKAGITTTTLALGDRFGRPLYIALHLLPYPIIAAAATLCAVTPWALLSFLALPPSLAAVRVCLSGETHSLEGRAAGIHFLFGALLSLGLLLARLT